MPRLDATGELTGASAARLGLGKIIVLTHLRAQSLPPPLATRSVLAILQIYAAVSSLSLSIFATAIDAVFDPLANFVLK